MCGSKSSSSEVTGSAKRKDGNADMRPCLGSTEYLGLPVSSCVSSPETINGCPP